MTYSKIIQRYTFIKFTNTISVQVSRVPLSKETRIGNLHRDRCSITLPLILFPANYLNHSLFQPKMFCKTCGSLLVPKKTSYGKWMSCPPGHTQPELNQEEKVLIIKNLNPAKKVEVADGKNLLAVHDHNCKKCGYDKAELIEISADYSDEDNIYRLKCGQCGFVEQ